MLFILSVLLRGAVWAQKTRATIMVAEEMPLNPIEKDGWVLLWHDEFDIDSIDYAHWWIQDCERKGESAYFTQRLDNVCIKDGKLLITVKKERYKNFEYTGGLVYASRKIEKNSYVEVAVRIPRGKGFWPAFWFHDGFDDTYQEVDVLETYGNQTSKVSVSNYYWDSTKNAIVHDWRQINLKDKDRKTFDLADSFNVFGLEWTDSFLRIYLNNELFQEINQHVPKNPMHLILGMGLGGAAGKPNRRTPFPSTYEIDYVRVYKKQTIP